jgi:hypothetical protein
MDMDMAKKPVLEKHPPLEELWAIAQIDTARFCSNYVD